MMKVIMLVNKQMSSYPKRAAQINNSF